MLDRDYDAAAVTDFGLGRQGEENASCERDDWYDGGLWGRFVFMVAEGTGVEDAVCALVVRNCLVAEVDRRFWGASGELFGVLIDVVEIVLCLLALGCAEERRHLHRTWNLWLFFLLVPCPHHLLVPWNVFLV